MDKNYNIDCFRTGLRCHFNIDFGGEQIINFSNYTYLLIKPNIIEFIDKSHRTYYLYINGEIIIYNKIKVRNKKGKCCFLQI